MKFDLQLLNEQIQKESKFIQQIQTELSKVLIGQKNMVRRLLIGLLSE